MRIAISAGALLTAVALCLMPAGVARAQLVPEPVDGFFGFTDGTPNLVVNKDQGKSATNAVSIVYDNTTSAANFGFSSTDPLANFGDELFTTGVGVLSTQQLSLFNSGSSLGPLLTATLGVQFFDAVTSALLGSYNVNVNFGTGLNPGFFTLVNVTALDPLAINLTTTDVIVIQRIVAKTGTASRLGIVSLNPPTIGASPGSMYISASTTGGGVPGFYNIASGPANPGYQIGVSPPPVGAVSKSWSQLKKLYR